MEVISFSMPKLWTFFCEIYFAWIFSIFFKFKMVALIVMHCILMAPAEYPLLFCYCLEIWKLLQNLIYCIIPLQVIIMSPPGKTIFWGLRVVKVKTFCYQYLLQRCTIPSTSSTWWKYLSLLSVDGKELCRGQKNSWSSDMTSQILCNVSLELFFFLKSGAFTFYVHFQLHPQITDLLNVT